MLTTATHLDSPPKQAPRATPGARHASDAAEAIPKGAARYGRRYVHVYLGNNPKAVEVEVGGQWYEGVLCSWDQADDRSWSGVVTWRRAPGETLVDRFPADRIREAAVDHLAC